jgi:uncharacterized membrane protein YphA (DoxX/SURF4 family)
MTTTAPGRTVRETPEWVRTVLDAPATIFAARLLLTSAFWTSGVMKLTDIDGAVAEVQGLGLPWPMLVATLTIGVQLLGSASVVFDRSAWLGAGALGVFTLLATLVAHAFWVAPPVEQARQFATFAEHLGLIGGLFLAAALSERARRPRP